jgi:HSP20 family molecular chaperone IbpA
MDIETTIPVRLDGPESIEPLLNEVRERITRRAYENFVDRGAVHGHDLDDWLNAERELIIKPAVEVYVEGHDMFVEVNLPEIDLANLTVHIAPSQLLISSDADEDGLQLCRVIDLPVQISLDGVDAEQLNNVLRINAAVA